MADGQASPALRHGPFAYLLVKHLDVAQMARGVARPPDAVRVGRIEFDPPCIRLHDRQRELRPRFRLGIEAGDSVRRLQGNPDRPCASHRQPRDKHRCSRSAARSRSSCRFSDRPSRVSRRYGSRSRDSPPNPFPFGAECRRRESGIRRSFRWQGRADRFCLLPARRTTPCRRPRRQCRKRRGSAWSRPNEECRTR